MKRFLLALAAVAAITVGSSFTNSAMAHGPGYGHHHSSFGYGGYGGGYGRSYSSFYAPSYGYGGYGSGCGNYGGYGAYAPAYVPAYGYGYPGSYGYGNGGVIQLYGPRGGFTFGF